MIALSGNSRLNKMNRVRDTQIHSKVKSSITPTEIAGAKVTTSKGLGKAITNRKSRQIIGVTSKSQDTRSSQMKSGGG